MCQARIVWGGGGRERESCQVKVTPYKNCNDNMKLFFSLLLSPHADHHLSSRVTVEPFWDQMKKETC